MSDIDLRKQEAYSEAMDRLDTLVTEFAIMTAKDDDYSLSKDLFDCACNDDRIRQLLNECAAARLEGRHPDCLYLGVALTKFAADFYKDHAGDHYDD
jgi:hypothetical protein